MPVWTINMSTMCKNVLQTINELNAIFIGKGTEH
uniref:Uncharacterized protein n=1 Tax=Anguilla anguilla TaxID=7936 RepID=A0A0E9T8D5_ANGAN